MSNNDAALQYMRALTGSAFWGFLTLKFENGQIVHVRREENLKPNELPNLLPGRNRNGSQTEPRPTK